MNELAAAAMNVRIASGKEEKVKAEEELNRLIQEEIDKLGGVENMSQIVLESFESSIGTSKEQLLQIEKMKTSYSAFGNEVEDTNGLFASLTSVFGTVGEFLIGSASGFGQLILQAALFSFFMGGPVLKSFGLVLGAIKSGIVAAGSFIAKLLGIKAAQTTVAAGGAAASTVAAGGGAAASTLASGVGGNNFAGTGSRQAQAMAQNRGPGGRFSGGFKPPPGPTSDVKQAKAMGGMATSLLKGAAAMLLMAAALFVFAKAMQEMKNVGVEELGMAIASILVMAGGLVLLGKVAGEILIGAAAMLVMAAALFVFGKAIQEIAVGVGMLEKLPAIFTPLASLAGGLALFGLAMTPFSLGLIQLAAGLAVITPVLPTLLALVALGAGIALIANALGYGGGSSEESSS